MKKSVFKKLAFGFAALAVLSCFSGCNHDSSSGSSEPSITSEPLEFELPSDIAVKKGKNYKVSADIKADKETSYLELEVKDDLTYSRGNREIYGNVTTDYKTYSVTTGTSSIDWTKGVLNVKANAKLDVINIKVEEISDVQNFGIGVGGYGNLHSGLTVTEDASAKTLTLDFASENKLHNLGADIALLNEPLDVGSLYKFTFNVTSDVALSSREEDGSLSGKIAIWGHPIDDDYESAGSDYFSFDANTKKNITLYLPVYQKESEPVRIPYIWFSSAKKAKITISDLKAEKVTDFKKELEGSELSLFFAGTEVSTNNYVFSPADNVLIPANSGKYFGQLILSDLYGWGSTENAVASFRVLEKGTGSGLNPEVRTVNNDRNIWFENTSDKDIYVKFGLNEKFEVTIASETSYTVIYNGQVVESVSESELSSYKTNDGLIEGTDYAHSGTTITLTDSGYKKMYGETVTIQVMGGGI